MQFKSKIAMIFSRAALQGVSEVIKYLKYVLHCVHADHNIVLLIFYIRHTSRPFIFINHAALGL